VIELERALVDLGRELEVPAAPDLATAVLARIEPRAARRPRPRPRRLALAVAFAVLAALGATLAIPEARSALLRVLHIGGERIELVDELPEVTVQTDLELTLGSEVPLEEVRNAGGFDLRELDATPDRVYLGERGTVWFLYGTPDRVRLLVAQTPLHSFDEGLMAKKLASPETRVELVAVGSSQGAFLSGEPHFVFLLDAAGQIVDESARLAGNVLIWDEGGVAYRLEGDFTRDEALDLAASLR
jgi:hypothetical protein